MLQEIEVKTPSKLLTDTRVSFNIHDATVEFQVRLNYGNIIYTSFKLSKVEQLSEKKVVEQVHTLLKPDVAHIVKVARQAAVAEQKRIKRGDTFGNKNNKSSPKA